MAKNAPTLRDNLVDQLGALKARIAELTEQEAELKQELIDSGYTEMEGDLFRATVSTYDTEVRDGVFKALIEALVKKHTSSQYRRAHTQLRPKTVVRVVARTRKVAA